MIDIVYRFRFFIYLFIPPFPPSYFEANTNRLKNFRRDKYRDERILVLK